MIKKIIFISILFIFTLNGQQAVEKKLTLDEEFIRYVPINIQKECEGLDDICKKFYIGYYLLDNRYKASKSLQYLVESYEQNASRVVDYMEARNYYLTETIARLYEGTGHYNSAIKYYEYSINSGNKRAICYIGHVYNNQRKRKQAFSALKQGAKEHFVECYTDLGMYYFNDEFGVKNRLLAEKFWKLAYKDSSYGVVENYNMGVYSEYKKDTVKNKFYTLKAAKLGDKDAQRYLNSHLKGVSSTKLFLEEALGSHFWDVSKRRDKEFSNNYDLYYRFKKMFNRDGNWIEDDDYEDKFWKKNKDVIVKFNKKDTSLIFDQKKLILQTKFKNNNRVSLYTKDIPLLYEVLLVDLSGAKEIVDLYHELIGRLTLQKSFEYSRGFVLYGYDFIWYTKYAVKTHKLLIEIQID